MIGEEALPGGKHLVARQILKTSDATDVKLKEKNWYRSSIKDILKPIIRQNVKLRQEKKFKQLMLASPTGQ